MKIFISTGDVSGDLQGALLVRQLKRVSSDFQFYAVGGEKLKEAGASLIEDSSDWGAIGIFDALPKIPKIFRALQRVQRAIEAIKPEGMIYIDCPAFNLRLARRIFQKRIPSVYFFPPSQWRNNVSRAFRVGKLVNRVIAPFSQSAAIYQEAGVSTFFSGHPLLDLFQSDKNPGDLFLSFHISPEEPVLGLFPGSREQEIHYLLPLQLRVAAQLRETIPSLRLILPVAKKNLELLILSQIEKTKLPVTLVKGQSNDVMRVSTVLLLASGTATLEALILGKPMVIVYKLSPWSWFFERPFLQGIRFAGLPNLLAGKEIVPEFLQEKATLDAVSSAVYQLFHSSGKREVMLREFQEIRSRLGTPPIMEKVAQDILRTFQNPVIPA